MVNSYEEKICVCALNRILGFEPKTAHGLIGAAGSAWGVFNLSEDERMRILGPYSRITPMLNERELKATEEELSRLEDSGCTFITMSEPGYPDLLKECDDAPLGLYFKGSSPPAAVFNVRPQIAVVGTRDISLYGKEWCRKIVSAMGQAKVKPLIISGFAYGTDIIAHLAALEAGLPTVAVLPTGIDDVYPPRHQRYAGALGTTSGCALVSDYPPGTEPKAINFIRRNRIIAGACSATILIESKAKGGGLITARLASSYDRDLLVLPGRADDLRSQGCNALLREKLAEPITDTVHFLDMLGLGSIPVNRREDPAGRITALYGQVVPEEELGTFLSVAGAVHRERGVTVEALCDRCGLTYSAVSRIVGILESDGIISTDLLQRCMINLKNM